MKRRALLLAAGALALSSPARGQSARVPRVGVIYFGDIYEDIVQGLRAGLKEIGVVEGRDAVLEIRNAKGDPKLVEDAARAFEREKVAFIYSVPTTTSRLVLGATASVPVVFCVGTDPISSGFVASYAKPGGRMTGVHYLNTDLTAKRVELLKQLLPRASRIVTLYNADNPTAIGSVRLAREATKKLGLQLIERPVRNDAELDAALAQLKRGEMDALLYVADAFVQSRSHLVIKRTKAIRLPTLSYSSSVVELGALASYGVDTREAGRQSASHVQRVLAGARPADLPVENVTRLIYTLNRRTAREIGFTVTPEMLVRFDRVIE